MQRNSFGYRQTTIMPLELCTHTYNKKRIAIGADEKPALDKLSLELNQIGFCINGAEQFFHSELFLAKTTGMWHLDYTLLYNFFDAYMRTIEEGALLNDSQMFELFCASLPPDCLFDFRQVTDFFNSELFRDKVPIYFTELPKEVLDRFFAAYIRAIKKDVPPDNGKLLELFRSCAAPDYLNGP